MYLDNIAQLCRLCSQDCSCGYFDIFTESDEKASLVILINKYLPIKVQEDDKLPKHICESCHIGVATTVDLIDRMVEGQHHLRVLYDQYYKELNKNNPKIKQIPVNNSKKKDSIVDKTLPGSSTFSADVDDSIVCGKCDIGNLEKSINETAERKLKNLDKLGICQDSTTIESKKIEDGPSAQVLIDIQGSTPDIEMNDLAKGMNVKKVYESHHLCLVMEGVQKEKKGRRRRVDSCTKYETLDKLDKPKGSGNLEEENQIDSIASCRPKRNKNVPTRYRDSLDETEYEEIITEDEDIESDANGLKNQIAKHNIEFSEFNFHCNKQEEKTHILEDTTVIVTSNHQDESLLNLPAAVNIELDFTERSLITKDCDGNNIASIDHTPKASVQAIEIVPKVEFFPPVMPTAKDLHKEGKLSFLNVPRRKFLKRKKKFSCQYCSKSFVHEGRYFYHLKLHNKVILICETCKEEFAQNDDLKSHQKSTGHSGVGLLENEIIDENKVFKCSICPERKFFSLSRYEKHLKTIHEGKKPFPCPTCSKSYVSEHSRNIHINVCHQTYKKKRFPCPECGKVFTLQASLMYHMDSSHIKGRKFVCKICGKAFNHKQLLQRHFYVHSEDRSHLCSICKKSFKTKGNLVNHMNLHTNSKVYTCELCGRQFNHLTALTQHKRLHTGERPYKCSYCGKCFSQAGNHQEHIRIHTGEKPYCCPECGKNFTTSSQMKHHQRRHKKDHKFRCSYCPKGFFQQDMWLSHEAKHLGEKKVFNCAKCEKSFGDKMTYQKHMKIHMLTLCQNGDKKIYECGVCSKQFTTSSTFMKHMMKHYGLKPDILSGFTEHHQPGTNVPPSISSNPEVVYILTKKDNNELEYISFDSEIFASNQSQTVVETFTSPGTSINHLPNSFICDGTPIASTSVVHLEEENGNAAFEISVKDPLFI